MKEVLVQTKGVSKFGSLVMGGGESFSFKNSIMLVASVIAFGAMVAGDTGGRFDRITLLAKRTRTPVSTTGGTTTGTTTGSTTGTTTGTTTGSTTGTTTGTTTTNSLYPELTAIPSNFDTASELIPAWGTGQIAGSDGDVVGAFRFNCNFSQILRDDPIVYPGQPGKSHLHVFFGNTAANAYSTYQTLRTAGEGTCQSKLNRSAYWAPAMLDGVGHVVMPDVATVYYKRRPLSDPKCSLTSGDPQAEGNCVPLPNGLRYIFGYDMLATGTVPWTDQFHWTCSGQTEIPWNSSDPLQNHYPSLTWAAKHCPTGVNPDGSHNSIIAVISAPNCWDGKNLDSPNHRDHVVYEYNTNQGYFRCPADHPFMIPSFTLSIGYTVDENLGTWRLASDDMHPELPAGSTLHSDWFGAWDNGTMATWMDNCINKKLTCSGGDLGNGKQMRTSGILWHAPQHLVAIPS